MELDGYAETGIRIFLFLKAHFSEVGSGSFQNTVQANSNLDVLVIDADAVIFVFNAVDPILLFTY